jgi:hypothetical protein
VSWLIYSMRSRLTGHSRQAIARVNMRVMSALNHPGFGGGIDPTKGWSHVSTAEVSA